MFSWIKRRKKELTPMEIRKLIIEKQMLEATLVKTLAKYFGEEVCMDVALSRLEKEVEDIGTIPMGDMIEILKLRGIVDKLNEIDTKLGEV